jgi:hypothetical protein
MDLIQETTGGFSRKSFISHVFSTTEEGKAELLNVIQYAGLGIFPIVILNKLISRFIPEADPDKSSIELLVEILLQVIIMFCGVVFIHRMITFIPTYSGFKYENLTLTNVILMFLVLVLSIQTKLGTKVNFLVDRVYEMWNGAEPEKRNKNRVRVSSGMMMHSPSQGDHLDESSGVFPPMPTMTKTPAAPSPSVPDMMMGGGPMPASSLLGSSFGGFF